MKKKKKKMEQECGNECKSCDEKDKEISKLKNEINEILEKIILHEK